VSPGDDKEYDMTTDALDPTKVEEVTDKAIGYLSGAGVSHFYEVRPRKDRRGVDLISNALPFGRLWYTKPDDAFEYAKFFSRSHDAVIRVYDEAGKLIETHEHKGEFQEF
jgi:hypothetical protein